MKKFLSMFLALAMCLTLTAPAGAADETYTTEDYDNDVICVRIWENPDLANDGEESYSVLRYGEREVVTVIQSWQNFQLTIPEGQPSGGYSFPNYGGSIYVNTSGGSTATFDLSLPWGEILSVGFSVGYTSSTAQVSGIAVNVPADTNHYKVQLRHNYVVDRCKIDIYQYTDYIRTTYVNKYRLVSIDALVMKV